MNTASHVDPNALAAWLKPSGRRPWRRIALHRDRTALFGKILAEVDRLGGDHVAVIIPAGERPWTAACKVLRFVNSRLEDDEPAPVRRGRQWAGASTPTPASLTNCRGRRPRPSRVEPLATG